MPPRRLRLDRELMRRGLADSREQASRLIADSRVLVSGLVATKPATQVTTDVAIVLREPTDGADYVSRGAHKLVGALTAFVPAGLQVRDRRCLDAGASTGGFTDVLLHEGAAEVLAVDVGYGQLHWSLRSHDRVRVHDRQNIRAITTDLLGGPVDLVVADLSFISLRLVLPALVGVTDPDGDLVLMVKPQFEVGKERVGKGGVVRDPDLWVDAVLGVVDEAVALGWGTQGVVASPLPGPSGNVEFFVWLRRGRAAVSSDDIAGTVRRGVADGDEKVSP